MALQITGLTAPDVAEVVNALLAAADTAEPHAPDLATRCRYLAHQLGDALDTLPAPTGDPTP